MSVLKSLKAARDALSKKVEDLKTAREINQMLSEKNIVYRFYSNSLKITNASTGMVYLITEDIVLLSEAPNGLTHKKVCEELLSRKFGRTIKFFESEMDYGDTIANEYHTIFIRMVSIINNVSVLYYPEEINEFQLASLKEFRNQLEEYNQLHSTDSQHASVVFIDMNGNESTDLNGLIEYFESKIKRKES